jgi:hypothetical protein
MLHPLYQKQAYTPIDMQVKFMDTNLLEYHKPDRQPWKHVFPQKETSHRLREKQNPYPKFNDESLSQTAIRNTEG